MKVFMLILASLIFVSVSNAGEIWDAFISQKPAPMRHCYGCQEDRRVQQVESQFQNKNNRFDSGETDSDGYEGSDPIDPEGTEPRF